ncbi:hypothetical protein ACEQ8H_008300 [Pleosporales sp. CAS-2024a]
MRAEPQLPLKQTTVPHPRLSNQGSQQSLTPSDAQSHERLLPESQVPIPSLKGLGVPRQHPHQTCHHMPPHPPAVSTLGEERPGTPETRRVRQQSNMDAESNVTTPGHDTTPYIRFAIDQLTRDEEVRGSRIYPHVDQVGDDDDEDDYPVERIVPDYGLGYMAQEQATQQRMSQHVAPKPQILHSPRRTKSKHMSAPTPTQPHQTTHAQYSQRPSSPRAQRDVFVATSPPHAPLNFLPAILRPAWLAVFTFLCLLMLGALLFTAVYSNRNGGIGLCDYGVFGDGRYFVFQYLPTLLGMMLLLWLIQVQTALQRVLPFMSMASDSFHRRSEAVFLDLYPMQFLLPNMQHFRARHRRVGACYVIFWLFQWTIPLLASSFNVRYDVSRRVWRWVAVQGVVWTVIVLYMLVAVALLIVLAYTISNASGLKWDPRSLADIIALLERANIMDDYNGSETFESGDWHRVANRADRIGHWTTTSRPKDVFYGIGEEGGDVRRFSVEQGRIKEKRADREEPYKAHGEQSDFSIRMDIRSPGVRLRYLPWYLRDTSVIAWIVVASVLFIAFLVVSFVNSAVRLGFLPQLHARTNAAGFSASNFFYSFIPALIGQFLLLTMLSFDYSLRALQPYISLSSNGGATAEQSLLVDYVCRLPVSVTLAALENKHFQTAGLSLVSLASTCLPVLAGGCFWTQYYDKEEVVRVAAHLSGYYALCFFLTLYTLGIFALIPGRRRAALPHRSNNLAEIISWVYQSPILSDRAFARAQTKPELVARLMGSSYMESTWTRSLISLIRPSRDNLRAESPTESADMELRRDGRNLAKEPGLIRYGFGIHVGRDGLEHLGIDRVRRNSGRELVIWEEQRKNKRKSWNDAA